MTAQTAIRVRGVEKSFSDLPVLRGVDFDVAAGSIFALLGSNGAGKTTLVRILSTLLKADAGTVTINGADVAQMPGQVRESISLTGQFAAVDEVLTGRENNDPSRAAWSSGLNVANGVGASSAHGCQRRRIRGGPATAAN